MTADAEDDGGVDYLELALNEGEKYRREIINAYRKYIEAEELRL